jgi:hypothetical protein
MLFKKNPIFFFFYFYGSIMDLRAASADRVVTGVLGYPVTPIYFSVHDPGAGHRSATDQAA